MELLDLKAWTWIEKSSYPFEAQLWSARAVHVGNDQFVLFGGQTCDSSKCDEYNNLDTIASYSATTDEWTMLGRLLTPREGAGVSVIQGGFLIFGGTPDEDQQPSEKCLFDGDQLECVHQNPTGPYGKSYILLLQAHLIVKIGLMFSMCRLIIVTFRLSCVILLRYNKVDIC